MTGPAPIRLSRNETEALCQKAARGAGMPWGLAEEAGFAAGWLAAHGIDGASALLERLTHRHGTAAGPATMINAHWQAPGGQSLCPIALGAALSDHSHLIIGPGRDRITTDRVLCPVLLLPFLDAIARHQSSTLALIWTGGQLHTGANIKVFRAGAALLAALAETPLSIGSMPATGVKPLPLQPAPLVAADTFAGLDGLALRTTVPATETSRRGAGAVSGDND